MPRILLAVFVPLVLAVPAAAAADESPAPRRPVRQSLVGSDLRLDGFVGPYGDTEDGTVGVVSGVSALLRARIFEAGILGQIGHESPGYGFVSGAVVAGVGLQARWGLRVDVLAQLGFDHYTGVGSGAYGPPPGVAALLPVLGGRLGLAYRFMNDARVHPEVGVWGVLETDARRLTVGYTCPRSYCGAYGPGPVALNQPVGTRRMSALFSLGLAFDLL